MEVKYKKSFIKDFNKLGDRKDQEAIHQICFGDVPEISELSEIKNLKKMKGYNQYYRIRKGNFRIGIKFEDDCIIFMRVLKREDIYKYFP